MTIHFVFSNLLFYVSKIHSFLFATKMWDFSTSLEMTYKEKSSYNSLTWIVNNLKKIVK